MIQILYHFKQAVQVASLTHFDQILIIKKSFKQKLQYFLRSFRGTGTWTKCRFQHNQGTDRNLTTQYRHSKVLMAIFIGLVLTGLFSPYF
jgi:hypothetical protein